MNNKIIMLADCQSFYASVEKAEHPEYKDLPLAVAGDPARRSGIILAACPIAKSKGVTTAERLGEALAKCPELVIIQPRMQLYIDVSMMITQIYQSYTDLVEPFSIDEQFLDVTGVMRSYGSPEKLAAHIQSKVMAETGIYVRLGIGSTKVIAKMACDNYAKKNKCGIFTLRESEFADTLWKLPIDKMYMVGGRMTRHFESMGFDTIGKLAATSLETLKVAMRRKFGRNADIDAELYWRIANGIDPSPVTPGTLESEPKSIGHMMTLPRDYHRIDDIKTVLLELTELVCRRSRSLNKMGSVVSVGCMGADYSVPTGFNRQMKMPDPSNITKYVYRYAVQLLQKYWDGLPVRKIGISLSDFRPDSEYQLSLLEPDREKWMALERTTDALKLKYGDTAIIRAVSATTAGQAKDRSQKIGGHFK